MNSTSHAALVDLAARWMRRQHFGVVVTEIAAAGSREQPDVIGFRASCSAVIEAKASRADFQADRKKPHRLQGGLGLYRFFICPDGLIDRAELPPKWGLLYASARAVRVVVGPPGNCWAGQGRGGDAWTAFQHALDLSAERCVLYSVARRMECGQRPR